MKTVRSITEVREAVAAARAEGRTIGFVPTMGFLHDGHLSLVDRAREAGAGFVVVSIFVNPTQFGPNEDYDAYPRDEARDRRLLEDRGVDLLFLPERAAMYPNGAVTRVHVGGVAEPLEGARRPGHFDGVATIVLKLFNIVAPDLAVFGRKDAQQCAVIERMVRDLDVPVELLFGETIRESDGLAMSSRNAYLDEDERGRAVALHAALQKGAEVLGNGTSPRDAEQVEIAMREHLATVPGVELDYLRLIDPDTFEAPASLARRPLLLAGAVRIGRTRLIDNLRVEGDAQGS